MTALVPLTDALTARDAATIRQAILDALTAKNVVATGWSAMAVQRALIEIEADSEAKQEAIRATVAAAGFLDTAAIAGDDWLDLLAKGFFLVIRQPATKAIHQFALTNVVGTAGRVLRNGALVSTTGSTPLVFRYLGGVVADVPGSGGNIPAGSSLVFSGSGLVGCVVTNPAIGDTGTSLVAAGADRESNANVIARCRGMWAVNSAGGSSLEIPNWIAAAFDAAGLTSTITKYRLDDASPFGPGSMALYCASDAGPATTSELDIVRAYILPRQTLGGGSWRILAPEEQIVTIGGTLFASGNPNAVSDAGQALVALEAEVPLGGTLYRSAIIQKLMEVFGVINVRLDTPPGDVVLAPGQVLVVAPDLVLG